MKLPAACCRVYNPRSDAVLGEQIRLAHNFWKRLVGLLGSRSLAPQAGLWLKPCKGIHTLGMCYSIDVVFLNRDRQVCKTASNVSPFRLCLAGPGTDSVLELPAGVAEHADVRVGDHLVFESVGCG